MSQTKVAKKLLDAWMLVADQNNATKETAAKTEVKEDKDTKRAEDSSGDSRSNALMLKRASALFLAGAKQGNALARNAVYPMELNCVQSFTASGGGVVAGSPRYGSGTLYPGFSTLSSVFARFRVVHIAVYFTTSAADNGSATTPKEVVLAVDTGDTSNTPGSLSAAWEIPGARIVIVANTTAGGPGGPLRPIVRTKIVPELEWLSTASGSQQGCIPFIGTGWTATTGTCSIWLRSRFEFSGPLV